MSIQSDSVILDSFLTLLHLLNRFTYGLRSCKVRLSCRCRFRVNVCDNHGIRIRPTSGDVWTSVKWRLWTLSEGRPEIKVRFLVGFGHEPRSTFNYRDLRFELVTVDPSTTFYGGRKGRTHPIVSLYKVWQGISHKEFVINPTFLVDFGNNFKIVLKLIHPDPTPDLE